ncbi:AraC family transcriptional regulator [Paenibacillus sp. RC67]|uniref:helix-turn-helix transcriptional regulator n=1 Tax=Paenibacillus sp. RC67 TaxID=3039392 RepID=UPI0024AD0A59|nr:AraC family transcriptional regulator [Paenibacillus sp. RC67]
MKSLHQDDPMRHLLNKLTIHLITAGYDSVGADWQRETHIPGYNRMFYILDGKGYIEVEGTRYYPEPGQLIIMPIGKEHSYGSISDRGFTKYWCFFKFGDTDLFQMYHFPVVIDVKEKARMTQLFHQIQFHFEQRRRTSGLMIKASMLELLTHFIDYTLEDVLPYNPTEKSEKLSRVLSYIQEHLAERITVEQLAQLAHYHPNYFIRYFHSILGTSPVQYIKHMRMEKSKTLLLTTQLPVSEIAREVGIEHSNFTPMFKKHTGFLPSSYREITQS